jgi:hypothetical protein
MSKTLLDSCVILSLTFSQYGTKVQVPKNLVTIGQADASTKADQDRAKRRMKTGKTILDDPRVAAIHSHQEQLRTTVIEMYTVPTKRNSFLRSGYYPLPIPLIKETNATLEEGRSIREALIEEAANALPDIIANDKLILEPVGAFNPLEYPTPAKFRARFKMRVEYLNFSVPGQTLQDVDPKLRAKVEQEFLENVEQAEKQAIATMQAMFTVLVTRMKEALEPSPDGKKKKFHESAITNILDYVKTFKQRWAAAAGSNDDAMVQLVNEAGALLEGTDVEAFRAVNSFRTTMHGKITAIANQLATLTEAQGRAYSFDEDDEEVAA